MAATRERDLRRQGEELAAAHTAALQRAIKESKSVERAAADSRMRRAMSILKYV